MSHVVTPTSQYYPNWVSLDSWTLQGDSWNKCCEKFKLKGGRPWKLLPLLPGMKLQGFQLLSVLRLGCSEAAVSKVWEWTGNKTDQFAIRNC
jgi:hypothetical protein